ncbi:response regulator [Corynebacterium minutissimum]|uniref:Response regulator transcription factor n=1 Tax=Corynebacterium minutissimum TaxID=38301 RepID=A0A2X4RWP3_9CORY|nr:response regulator transcription factor [Corynebacterium minutissimum]KHO29934.1 LuxR family transcriptional regulator [Corynebacterium minutissimum]QPS60410.1 response regulator transcription factor [Corynebacterium minutissimum]QQA78801.1 response regulator transcription factor [Corynebacterium minutissimum]SQI00740.1 transcription regulator [Corynebacterium minutissimum]VEG05192.1 transcription regulator [Corynebacterium minutissimum]
MVKVFLVDDHSVFRAGVRAELAVSEEIEIVGDAGTVAEALEGIARTSPDVVLLDVHMPDGGGLAVMNATAQQSSRPVFLALSVSDAAEDVIALIRAGARGYVTKNISGPDLAQAIAQVNSGDAYFSPRLAGFVLDAFASGAPAPEPEEGQDPVVDALTRRELEVLRLLARGYTYREIGKQLFISVKTVETHASNILRKTQQSNRHQLTRWATSRDLA